jgi:hypothetical protein
MAPDPICVELDEDDPENSRICVEDTERTSTAASAVAYWAEKEPASGYRTADAVWLRETDKVVYFGGTTAWETCSRRAEGARKFWKLAPPDVESIELRG